MKPLQYKRGEIYMADLDPVIGSEQGGIRPVLIVQNNTGNRFSPTVIVVPITSKKKGDQPTHVQLGNRFGLPKNSLLLAEQPKPLDKSRLQEQIGVVDRETMAQIDMALKISLDLRKSSPYRTTLCPSCASCVYSSDFLEIKRIYGEHCRRSRCAYCHKGRGHEYWITLTPSKQRKKVSE